MHIQFIKTYITAFIFMSPVSGHCNQVDINRHSLPHNTQPSDELNGTVWSSCSGSGTKMRYYFQDHQFAFTLERYHTDDCQGALLVKETYFIGGKLVSTNIEWTGQTATGGTIITETGVSAIEINFKYYEIERFDIAYIKENRMYLGISNGIFEENNRDTRLNFNKFWVKEH